MTRPAGADTGSSVLETALAIPALLLTAVLLLWGLFVGVLNVRMAVAANDLARGIARGEMTDQLIERVLPGLPQAQVSIERAEDMAHVVVRQQVGADLPILRGAQFTVEQRASAPLETWAP